MSTRGENALLIIVILLLCAFGFGYYETEKKVAVEKYPEPDRYVILVTDNFNVYYGIYDVHERNWSTKRSIDTCYFDKQKSASLVGVLSSQHTSFIFRQIRYDKFQETVNEMKKR